MITVQIDECDALEMLIDRLTFWTDDSDTIHLYRMMYSDYLDNGMFNDSEFNVMSIVDNDYINWCTVIDDSNPHFKEIMKAALNGERDISCEDFGFSYIEAYDEDKGIILVRS
jgi:hypothetical protein